MVSTLEPDHSFTRLTGQVLLALLAFQTIFQLVKRYMITPKYPRIPGPFQIPYIGRVHDLPLTYTWLKFKEWADEYGPMYMTSMFGHNLLVLTDESIVEDLLVKKAKIYSDRPMMRSLVDSKSTHGSMEYLPLMGKNGTCMIIQGMSVQVLTVTQNTGQDKGNGPILQFHKQQNSTIEVSWTTKLGECFSSSLNSPTMPKFCLRIWHQESCVLLPGTSQVLARKTPSTHETCFIKSRLVVQ